MSKNEIREKIEKTKRYFTSELVKIRGSRTNPHLIEDIKVKVYGSVMPIKQIGTVNVVDPTLITVQCWDKNNTDAVKSALQESDLDVAPSIDGSMVRIALPPLTEERRMELVKIVKKLAEDTKVSVRMIRREYMDLLVKDEGSEDEIERGKKEIQNIVNEFNEFIEQEIEKKEKELMTL